MFLGWHISWNTVWFSVVFIFEYITVCLSSKCIIVREHLFQSNFFCIRNLVSVQKLCRVCFHFYLKNTKRLQVFTVYMFNLSFPLYGECPQCFPIFSNWVKNSNGIVGRMRTLLSQDGFLDLQNIINHRFQNLQNLPSSKPF